MLSLVRCFSVVHKFLVVLKILSFGSNSKGVSLLFYQKSVCSR
jgi:hypothetical protein